VIHIFSKKKGDAKTHLGLWWSVLCFLVSVSYPKCA
jgi:hypothetical protein